MLKEKADDYQKSDNITFYTNPNEEIVRKGKAIREAKDFYFLSEDTKYARSKYESKLFFPLLLIVAFPVIIVFPFNEYLGCALMIAAFFAYKCVVKNIKLFRARKALKKQGIYVTDYEIEKGDYIGLTQEEKEFEIKKETAAKKRVIVGEIFIFLVCILVRVYFRFLSPSGFPSEINTRLAVILNYILSDSFWLLLLIVFGSMIIDIIKLLHIKNKK